jgi:hypothetical protein
MDIIGFYDSIQQKTGLFKTNLKRKIKIDFTGTNIFISH